MLDFLSFIIGFFLISLIVLIVLIGIKFFHSLATAGQSTSTYNEETDNQLIEDSREDSQADLYMTEEPENEDNLMFPQEFDDDDY